MNVEEERDALKAELALKDWGIKAARLVNMYGESVMPRLQDAINDLDKEMAR